MIIILTLILSPNPVLPLYYLYATVTYSMVLTLGLLTLVVSAQNQSPINIDTGTTLPNSNLGPLTFHQYDVAVSGDFVFTGTTMKFVPDSVAPDSVATLTTHKGTTYELQEVVFHWGSTSSEGSEHQVDSEQFAAEIQFVHLKRGASPNDAAADTYLILAMRYQHVSEKPRGVWSNLTPVPNVGKPTRVSKVVYDDLLPANRDYYQYEGSHTTSPYTENVQWYVMQNTIPIPEGFLDSLREVQISNFRPAAVQDLNGRSVFEFP